MRRTASNGPATISLLKSGEGLRSVSTDIEDSGCGDESSPGESPDFQQAAIHATAPRFDYASLAHAIRIEVDTQTAAIRVLNGTSLAGRIEIGRRLVAICKAVSGFDFQPLVSDSFGWTKSTTSNYMSVAREFGTIEPQRLARFDWSALVVLSRERAPQSARDEALARAADEQNINKALAEATVARHLDLPEIDPEAEHLINRVYQALNQFEKHHDRVTATQRDRVMQRLVALANLLNHASPVPETETETDNEQAASPDDGCCGAGVPTADEPLEGHTTPPDGLLSHAHPHRAVRQRRIRERSSRESSTSPTAPSRSRPDFQPAADLEPAAKVSADPASVELRLAATAEAQPHPAAWVSADPVSVGPRLAATEPVARRAAGTPSRRTFLASIGLALAALCGRRSSAATLPPVPLPVPGERPPIEPSLSSESGPVGDSEEHSCRDPAFHKCVSVTGNPIGRTGNVYTYSYDASLPIRGGISQFGETCLSRPQSRVDS